MERKPYLLSLASNTSGAKRYLASLGALENSVEWISIEFDPSFIIKDDIADQLTEFHRAWPGIEYPGNLKRFEYAPEIGKNRWLIFTDTGDVIFQAPIPDLGNGNHEVLVSCENELWQESSFFAPMIETFAPKLDALKDKPIYCMGTWAMKGGLAQDLMDYLHKRGPEFGNHPLIDQALFNLWLQDKNYAELPGLFTTLYKNHELGRVTQKDGKFYQDGVLAAIVHANGNTKELLPKVL